MQKLLDEIYSIVERDQAEREELERAGGYFNIFDILGFGTEEVRLHSAFLAELMNPYGSHGMKDRFLKLFLKTVPALSDFKFPTTTASVCTEYYIGPISKDGARGGRIDILVSSGSKAIIIENKIYAEDQENQIVRYSNYAHKYSDCRILYLTLDGHSPEESSTGSLLQGLDFFAISYADDILQWLEGCVKVCCDKPLAKNTIAQYIELLKELTNQMNNELNEKEIMKLLTKVDNVAKTAAILDRKAELQDIFYSKYLYARYNSWAKHHGFEINKDLGYPVAVRPTGWKNHWIILYVATVNFDVCILKTSGRKHKQMQLSQLTTDISDMYPFGWGRYTAYFSSLQDVVSGTSFKFLVEITEEILSELEDRRSELEEKKITL